MLKILFSSLNVKLSRKYPSDQRRLWLLLSTKISVVGLPFPFLKVISSVVDTILFLPIIWESGYVYKWSLAKVYALDLKI